MTSMISQSQPGAELDPQNQIKALLDVARCSRQNPGLTLEELSVAIIAVQPNLTLVELQRHILTAFKYYNKASVESSIMRGYQASLTISKFNTTFATLLRRFDLPFEVIYDEDDEEGDDTDELYVSPVAAQIFLQKHLTSPAGGKSKQPFPFLKLPCEIRLQIYGHCLGLPKSGVSVRQAQRHCMKKEVVVRTKDFDAELDISEWEDVPAPTGVRARWDNFEYRNRHDGTLTCQDLRTHLALLRVNKEIFNEAMPVFYSLNSFVCSDLYHLESFLATLAPERREQLRHISFFYTKNTHSKAAKAFKMLGEIEKLKRLDIVIDEADFVGLAKAKGERMFPDVLKLPGFHTLKSMRTVKTVQFHGECDTIREALQSWIVDNEVKAEIPEKKKTIRKAKPKVEALKEIAPVAEQDEHEDALLFGTATGNTGEDGEALAVYGEDAQYLTQDTTPESTLLSSHYFDAPSPKPSTPRNGEAKGLMSPFKFQPSNSDSHLANRFQMQSPFSGGHNYPLADFGEHTMASDALMPSIPLVPDIGTRIRQYGPGQMGDWKPPQLAFENSRTSMEMPPHTEFSYQQGRVLQMEDLLVDRDEYEMQ